jgi:RHH-type proline utilization regulon transcriptional repressor/proline dehydrogenase/delta 1-pyrroline-5-carboxylate dehydrogenase
MGKSTFEQSVEAIGREIFSRVEGQRPSVFQRDFWSGKLLDLCMKDDAFKTEMFRFVDVFPVLKSSDEIARHVREYFQREGQSFGFLGAAMGFAGSSFGAKIGAAFLEKNILSMAKRFIAGANAAEALPLLTALRKEGLAFTVDLLGEATCSESEADAYTMRYADLLDGLAREAPKWAPNDRLDRDASGPIPRVNVSVKVSALYSQMDAIDPDGAARALHQRLGPLFRRARELGAFINLDMEQYALKDVTLRVFRELLESRDLADWPHAGIAIQAYLRDAERDVRDLAKWAKKRKTPIAVRLVKGAYWDFETVLARQRGWPVPVFENKPDTDASFEACATVLLENHKHIHLACASHNIRSIAHTVATARALKLPESAIEIQMLFGMAEPIKASLSAMGLRVRDYVPVGELIPGMAYFVRRLLENTSNESFLRQRFAEEASIETLLAPPAERAKSSASSAPPAKKRPPREPSALERTRAELGAFHNEPPFDFAQEDVRESMQQAIVQARRGIGQTHALYVGGRERRTDRLEASVNPARPSEIIGHACQATAQDVSDAIAASRSAFPAWRDTDATERARILVHAAAWIRDRHFDLAALEVLEAGKTWREADADVGEAIDFLEYYAREALRLAENRRMGDAPGEVNQYFYEPRGVGVVIAPWNFPLAILCGMTSAALVTGNTVIMKPAPQTPVIAARLYEAFRAARLPDGVLQLLYGGAEVGEPLATDPSVDFVTFTGSKAVGLRLIERCGQTKAGQRNVKRVVAEMGGKNAIVIDSDADLDEAVQGVVASAFGFQGQKCSACSRAIVVGDAFDVLMPRLIEATRSLVIGAPEDPATRLGPLIDARAKARVEAAIARGEQDARLVLRREAPADGFFVGPTIFADVPPSAPLAQEEIFGPVLAVMRAASFDEALEIACGTEFALTGGLFSRSPARIDEARRRFRVGNLYINRGITGALVERQPFGGAAMSGVGSKAGGPDYLLQFVEPRVVTENTLRRGFAPADE